VFDEMPARKCHIPKIWNVKINKNKNHVCLSGFKISQRIKILIDLKTLSEKAFSNFLLVLLEEHL
jgi:hypothetical protein